jgi:hypothetical protein
MSRLVRLCTKFPKSRFAVAWETPAFPNPLWGGECILNEDTRWSFNLAAARAAVSWNCRTGEVPKFFRENVRLSRHQLAALVGVEAAAIEVAEEAGAPIPDAWWIELETRAQFHIQTWGLGSPWVSYAELEPKPA